jgi:hypothetical protein
MTATVPVELMNADSSAPASIVVGRFHVITNSPEKKEQCSNVGTKIKPALFGKASRSARITRETLEKGVRTTDGKRARTAGQTHQKTLHAKTGRNQMRLPWCRQPWPQQGEARELFG